MRFSYTNAKKSDCSIQTLQIFVEGNDWWAFVHTCLHTLQDEEVLMWVAL